MSYILFIDESGDEGTEEHQIEAGASPMFFFGAFLVHEDNLQLVRDSVFSTREQVGRTNGLHFKNIRSHSKKMRCCKNFSTLPITMFGLISDKSQLDREDYRQQLQKWKGGYYNKNVAYLMEAIGKFCQESGIAISRIVFEQKNHDYRRMKNYLCTVRDDTRGIRNNLGYAQGGYHNANYLNGLDFQRLVFAQPKAEESALEIADAIAYSLNNACVEDEFQNTTHCYIQHLKNGFHADAEGRILEHGIKAVIDFDVMQMSTSDKDFISSLTKDS